jgi:mono/diheme cytochrome c family protein
VSRHRREGLVTTRSARLLLGGLAAAILCLVPLTTQAEPDKDVLAQGKAIYGRLCSGCHGDEGKGETFKSWLLSIEPRDLTAGAYKLRSTPRGKLPTDADLHRTIRYGILRSAMPQYRRLSEEEIEAVAAYVKTFSDRWATEGPGQPIEIPEPPEDLMAKASVTRGKAVYGLLQCGSCHGDAGRGDGPMADKLDQDAWGEKQRSADLRRGIYKSGDTEKGLYRAVVLGLDGTSMHAFGSLFTEGEGKRIGPQDAWHLVAYVLSLRER